jgi:hypothetical protein
VSYSAKLQALKPRLLRDFTAVSNIKPSLYCVSEGPDVGDILDSMESLEAFARDHGPGGYDVDEHSLTRSQEQRSRPGLGAR